jgi:hypothetical protein
MICNKCHKEIGAAWAEAIILPNKIIYYAPHKCLKNRRAKNGRRKNDIS